MSFRTLIFSFLLLSVNFVALSAESEVVVRNEAAGINLAGTLTVPNQEPVKGFVVMVTGSGAQNRDEEVFGLKPFKNIADTLAVAGYGVLRMDDRGVGQSEGDYASATINDFTDDAVAGVKYIRNLYPEHKVGMLGHSQGGLSAMRAAANGDVDFIVTLATPAWPGDSIVMSQCRALAVATTGSWGAESVERRLLDIAKSNLPASVAQGMLMVELTSELRKSLGDAVNMPEVQRQLSAQTDVMLSPAYRDLLRYDPADDIRKINVPWLAMNGDKDLQVVHQNLKTMRELNPSVRIVTLPDHNHLFQKAVTGLPDEYPRLGQTPSPEALSLLIETLNQLLQAEN